MLKFNAYMSDNKISFWNHDKQRFHGLVLMVYKDNHVILLAQRNL